MNLLHCAREIPSHTPCERVPRPGRITNVFEGIGATTEKAITVAKKQRPMFALFYRNILRPHASNATTGFDEAGFICDFARFAIVQDEQIDAVEQRIEIRSRCL